MSVITCLNKASSLFSTPSGLPYILTLSDEVPAEIVPPLYSRESLTNC